MKNIFNFPGVAQLAVALLCTSSFVAMAAPQDGLLPTVRTLTISVQDIVKQQEYVGHIEAIQRVELRARVEGFIDAIGFSDGALVHKGQVLYVIEQAAYKAMVEADRAKVSQAQAEMARTDIYLKRLNLARKESISATALDDALAADLAAKASLAAAKAALDISQLNLKYTRITAPVSGRIGRTNYTLGNLVNPASGPLALIVQIDPIRVVYSISENDLPAIQKSIMAADQEGHRLLAPQLRLANGEALEGSGRVTFVDNQVDPGTGTIAVRAEFDNKNGHLLPGQYVTVLVKDSAPVLMPVVPQAAVLVNQNGRYVLTVENGVAQQRPIVVGPQLDTMWAVESGLSAGEQIIISGIQKVTPGQPVNAIPADAQEQ